jgi:hypothetical protein
MSFVPYLRKKKVVDVNAASSLDVRSAAGCASSRY